MKIYSAYTVKDSDVLMQPMCWRATFNNSSVML